MLEQPKLAILLPTYNGDAFLEEQVDSLLCQSYKNIIIITRDDGSTDQTAQLMDKYKAENPALFHVLESDGLNLGASENVSFLISYVLNNKQKLGLNLAYMMLCDQDDVWRKDKVAIEMAEMLKAEAQSAGLPILVHSDLQVVGKDGGVVAASFMAYQGLEPKRKQFRQQAISNIVTGCTALFNEALATKAMPISKDAIMHDWWLSLCAAAFGKLVYLPITLVKYRQHGNNTIGAKEHRPAKVLSRSFLKKLFDKEHSLLLSGVVKQAEAFHHAYKGELTKKQDVELFFIKRLDTESVLLRKCLFRALRS